MTTRRQFLAALSAFTTSLLGASSSTAAGDALGELLPTRLLGKTGESVTMLGVGGAHVASVLSERDAERAIESAMEGGVRFFDNAASYGSGEGERRYGKYLTPKYRDYVFLMTKAHLFDAASVRRQLDQSLLNLKTDYLDLWQMHQVMDPDDADVRIAGGVLDVFMEAKESGKVRHIGFTGHRTPAAHQRVLEKTDIFETCQMPINCADPTYGSFIQTVMPLLVERNMGIIAMKTLACGGFFGGDTWFQGGSKPKICPDRMSVREAIHFVWSLPVSTLVTGPNDLDQLQEKIDLARSFSVMNEEDRLQLIQRAADLTPNAGVEFYKAQGLSTACDWMVHG
ncbi:MAG: aldo/keto reductase [Candidatus Omnitrophica bacterium]|nr:aldo/keto reductase [Candidatus Omnitrophota bacterium]